MQNIWFSRNRWLMVSGRYLSCRNQRGSGPLTSIQQAWTECSDPGLDLRAVETAEGSQRPHPAAPLDVVGAWDRACGGCGRRVRRVVGTLTRYRSQGAGSKAQRPESKAAQCGCITEPQKTSRGPPMATAPMAPPHESKWKFQFHLLALSWYPPSP